MVLCSVSHIPVAVYDLLLVSSVSCAAPLAHPGKPGNTQQHVVSFMTRSCLFYTDTWCEVQDEKHTLKIHLTHSHQTHRRLQRFTQQQLLNSLTHSLTHLLLLSKQQPKHKDSSFIIINDTEKQQIITFKRPKPAILFTFSFKNDNKTIIDY